jgi:hypothetical protein
MILNVGDICRYDYARQVGDGFVLDENVVRVLAFNEAQDRAIVATHSIAGPYRQWNLEQASEILTPLQPAAEVYQHPAGLVAFL